MSSVEKKGSDWRPVFKKSLRCFLHLLRLAGFTLGLLCLLALFHLVTLGLPDGVTRQVTARARKAGLPLQVDSIRLSLHRGWVLKNMRLYSPSPDDLKPLLRTKNLYVFLWPDNWTAPSKGGWHASLYAKNSEVSMGRCWEEALRADCPFQTVSRLNASLYIRSGQLQLEDSELRWTGLRILASGRADFSDQPPADKPSRKAFPEIGAKAAQLANALDQLQFETDPEIKIGFTLNANAPEENRLEATCSAKGLLWNNRTYDQIDATLLSDNRQITLPLLQIAQTAGDRLTARGSFDPKSRIAELSLNNSLPAEDLLALFPARVRNVFDQLEIHHLGPVEVTADFGPAPPEQLLEQIHAEVRSFPITRKDLTLDPFRFKLTRSGNRLTVDEADALANGGPIKGTFEMDLDSRAWNTSLQGTVQPRPIGTLVGPGLENFIDRFRFPNDPPDIAVTLSHSGTQDSFKMTGTISGNDFTCAGVPMETLQTAMVWSKGQLTLDPLRAAHGNKLFDGNIQIDFAEKMARFNATNSFAPPSIARVLAPEQPTLLEQFTFSGPVQAEGSGQVDYGAQTNHAFSGTLQAEQVSTDIVLFDRFNSRIEGRGTQLLFSDSSAQLYGGRLEGSAAFDLLLSDGKAPYRMQVDATKIDLASMLQYAGTNDHTRTRGLLSGNLDFTADAKAGFWPTASGGGKVNVEKGHLASIPLFSGLSRLIQSPFPGFKLFSISTFSADYELGGGKLRSGNMKLGGTLLSAGAKGSYSPTDGFNVRLRAEPLRQTRENKEWYQLHLWSAEVLKLGTSPLFNLLDASLEGTLENPQWRLLVVPKELYGVKSVPAKPSPEPPAQP